MNQPPTEEQVDCVHVVCYHSWLPIIPKEVDEVPLLTSDDGSLKVLACKKASHYLSDVNLGAAIGIALLTGKLGKENGLDQDAIEQIKVGVDERQAKKYDKGAFLVIEIRGSYPVELSKSRSVGDFLFGLDIFPWDRIQSEHEPTIAAVLSAIPLVVGDVDLERVSSGVYGILRSGRKVYSGHLRSGNVRVVTSKELSVDTAGKCRDLCLWMTDSDLKTVARILSRVFQELDNNFRAFIDAWTALEVFVEKAFSSIEDKYYLELQKGRSLPFTDFIAKTRAVMKGKYNLLDKFQFVASVLDPGSCESDVKIFKEVQKFRQVVHGQKFEDDSLPTDKVLHLLRRYIPKYLRPDS